MLDELLRSRDWLLADGATGTNLFDMGLVSGEAPEAWLDSHPDRIVALHRRFIAAGADIILTNTFGCNRRRLALHGLQDQTRRLNETAVGLARQAAAEAGRPIVIAGSVGPTGDLLAPLGPLTAQDCEDVFVEQIEGLAAGGAHVAWIETMSAVEEMHAAARAARRCGLPYVITASFDTAGRTMMGHAPGALAQDLTALDPPPPLTSAERLTRANAHIVGVVLNALDFNKAEKYYGEYSGYGKHGYGNYSSTYGNTYGNTASAQKRTPVPVINTSAEVS